MGKLTIKDLAKRVIELQLVLKPFADFADMKMPRDFVITQGSPMAKCQLTMEDCQRAKTVLDKR